MEEEMSYWIDLGNWQKAHYIHCFKWHFLHNCKWEKQQWYVPHSSEKVSWICRLFLKVTLLNVSGIQTQEKPQLVWLSGLRAGLWTKGSPVWFLVRAHAWVTGQVPSRGHERGNHTLMFLSFSFSLLSPLTKNK